jgi:membrane protein required for colicin V production
MQWPITLLDIILLVVMLISGLLAMIRGFMREVLSIAAWIIAALTTLYALPRVLPMAKTYFANEIVANGVAIGGVFLLTLLLVTIVTVRISDLVLDSRIGALDRTLGFLFGLGRGFLVVTVAYAFFNWLVPVRQPEWISGAKSLVVLKGAGDWLRNELPSDLEKYLSKSNKPKLQDQDAPPDAGLDRRSQGAAPTIQALNSRTH